ncbi:MAG TPA: hypothetical protein VFR59_01290 [Steroidobacteraceae bacterium]|nr:hypothetical protein [Steroidobacteraceae bacterium]
MSIRTVLRAASWIACLALLSPAVWAATSQQKQLVDAYLRAVSDKQVAEVVSMVHAGDVEALRTRVMKALDEEKAGNGSTIKDRMFGKAASVEELRRLTPPNLLLAITRRMALPTMPTVRSSKILGIVEDSDSTHYAVARAWPQEKEKGTPRIALVTLRKAPDKTWRIGIPDSFLAQVEAALEGDDFGSQGAAPDTGEKPAATNTPEMLQTLQAGVQFLRDGNCASYLTVVMSPKFRASKTDKALKTLIQQCERSIDMRETYVSALEIASRSAPDMRENGTLAFYDLTGQGLPFNGFSLESIEGRWYVAE